jgi:hypothetical protein
VRTVIPKGVFVSNIVNKIPKYYFHLYLQAMRELISSERLLRKARDMGHHPLLGDIMLKKLLLVIVLLVLAISGCMEKGPSGKGLSVEEIKTLSVSSADNLSTYSLRHSVDQILKSNAPGSNETRGNLTTILESVSSVNLTAYQAMTNRSTKTILEIPGKAGNTSLSQITVYQFGNLTYIKDNGKWISLREKRPTEAIWGSGNISQVKALAKKINQSQAEIVGSEKIGGEDAYELKISFAGDDYHNLNDTAYSIAAKLIKNPLLVPFINTTELNKTSRLEKLVWISKETYLPLKYYSSMSFKMTPVIVGGRDAATGRLMRLNQSVSLGEISVDLVTTDLYQDFNQPVEIKLPEDLKAATVNPTQLQVAPKA